MDTNQEGVIRDLEFRLTEAEKQHIEKVMNIRAMKEKEAIEEKKETDLAIHMRDKRIASLKLMIKDQEDELADKDTQLKQLQAELLKLREEHEQEKCEQTRKVKVKKGQV
ncbi:probable cyclin-dependent serine/threonine-protein kinase DDB_G0278487 [Penaeus monodon]|uniref:probable cyclin-dependent serine/threonine-protein kinase DDB_G0278487 n=1 Tax=Penaeus monodon TaxID=6687 RepID=UPI0018A73209|nr:probable cyclin-dependent serine/threonine-protein kinase DDB_G0278487 [Penaeus monodon]